MLKLRHALICIAAAVCAPLAHAACDEEGIVPCELPFRTGPIAKVVIKSNWTRTSIAPEETWWNCKEIPPLKPADVRRYMRLAGRVTHNSWQYVVSFSTCTAEGTLTTRGGRKATWVIGIFREARFWWEDADPANAEPYLYCGRCKAPFFD